MAILWWMKTASATRPDPPYIWRGWPMLILCLLLFAWALLASRMAKTL
jgi:hypothetical protein